MDNYEEETKVQNREESDILDLNSEEIKPGFEENEQIDSPLQIYAENVRAFFYLIQLNTNEKL